MRLEQVKKDLPSDIYKILEGEGIKELRPAQSKAVKAGLLRGKSLLVCTPTASGKTLVAEMAMLKTILHSKGKAVYIVPLKALATEKYKEFVRRYKGHARVALSIGDMDKADTYLRDFDLIICTSEKLDSLIRHHTPWLPEVKVVVVDEIHMLNDPGRGPTLEVLITLLRAMLPKVQVIALSATIGNPKTLAQWLGAQLVLDTWRPVELKEGVYFGGQVEFHKRKNNKGRKRKE